MTYSVKEVSDREDLKQLFISLPERIYQKWELMQDKKAEREILNRTHVLSHCFNLYAYLVTDEAELPVCRAILTIYPDNKTAFLGFFESIDNVAACKLLTDKVEQCAKERGCTTIVGPVDASIWIRYRFKSNQFDKSYTGEPYNPDYYVRLWESCGFQISQTYFSNHYRKIESTYENEMFQKRLDDKKAEGYQIVSPTQKKLRGALDEVYDLLIELYRSFPAYTFITKEEFRSLYGYLEKIVNTKMIKIAYYNGKAVGFFVSIPNYGNTVYGKLSLLDVMKIYRIRKNPYEYVMLYMGVDLTHKGLGKALANAIEEELKQAQVPSVGALIRKGNINKDYFKDLIDFEYEYVLLQKEINND